MPVRDILVVIDNEAGVKQRLAPVAALAKRVELRLNGLFATGLPGTQVFADLDGWAQLVDAYMAARQAEAIKVEQAFLQELARLHLAGEWHC